MIKARVRPENPDANLKSYYEAYSSFQWSDVENLFFKNEQGHVSIVYESIDKWADDPDHKLRCALIIEQGGTEYRFTYEELKQKSCKWANLFQKYNFKVGDRVFIILPTSPELYFAILACARLGLIFCILYPTLSYEEMHWRIEHAEPRGIITETEICQRLPNPLNESVQHIFLLHGPRPQIFSCETELDLVAEPMPEECESRFVVPETPLYLIFTSGSTGPPKGILHAHQDMFGMYYTAKYILDLNTDSVLWTDAEPAWVTGLIYGTFGPWLCGCTSVVQTHTFVASLWFRTLEQYGVTNWYTTPMTIRRLIESGDELSKQYDLTKLRHIASVGESLTPEQFYWIRDKLQKSVHDTWWMTETGMICIANFASQMIKPGSMGRPCPGIQCEVLDTLGDVMPILTMGELALKVGWPSMLKAVWKDEDRFKAYFKNGWFLTGDMVIKDEDGYFYHICRNDDLIKIGSNLMGPYDFERLLNLHPAVAESAVIAKPGIHDVLIIKAFLKLKGNMIGTPDVRTSIIEFLKDKIHVNLPEFEITFITELPKTRSGKLVRRVLRAMELGLPSGDPLNLKDA